jgi:hypothetical protein
VGVPGRRGVPLALLDAERRFVTNLIQALKDPPYQRVWHHKAAELSEGQT